MPYSVMVLYLHQSLKLHVLCGGSFVWMKC